MACTCGSNDDWRALLDTRPPEPPRLRVTGTVECTTLGHKNVRLVDETSPGAGATVLSLRLEWEAPTGPVGQMITPHQVEYHKAKSPNYDAVVIVNCGHKRIDVEVVA